MTGICPGLKHRRPVFPHNSEPFPEFHYGFVIQLGGERQKKHQPPLNLFFHIQELVPRQHIPCPFHEKHFLLIKIDIVVDKFYQVKFLYALNCAREFSPSKDSLISFKTLSPLILRSMSSLTAFFIRL